jgi:hypothetical protein
VHPDLATALCQCRFVRMLAHVGAHTLQALPGARLSIALVPATVQASSVPTILQSTSYSSCPVTNSLCVSARCWWALASYRRSFSRSPRTPLLSAALRVCVALIADVCCAEEQLQACLQRCGHVAVADVYTDVH